MMDDDEAAREVARAREWMSDPDRQTVRKLAESMARRGDATAEEVRRNAQRDGHPFWLAVADELDAIAARRGFRVVE